MTRGSVYAGPRTTSKSLSILEFLQTYSFPGAWLLQHGTYLKVMRSIQLNSEAWFQVSSNLADGQGAQEQTHFLAEQTQVFLFSQRKAR